MSASTTGKTAVWDVVREHDDIAHNMKLSTHDGVVVENQRGTNNLVGYQCKPIPLNQLPIQLQPAKVSPDDFF
jgi:hypothetical protein